MTAPTRPRRQNKADRLTSPGASSEQIMCDFALAPFDRIATEMEQTWGIDRLPGLVSPETAAKFGSAMAKLNDAINSDDPEAVKARAGVCIRGLRVMDAEAREAGHTPPPPLFWEYELDGEKFVFIRDIKDWPIVAKAMPRARMYSIREAALALAAMSDTLKTVKDAFPGAELSEVRPPRSQLAEELDDEIPF